MDDSKRELFAAVKACRGLHGTKMEAITFGLVFPLLLVLASVNGGSALFDSVTIGEWRLLVFYLAFHFTHFASVSALNAWFLAPGFGAYIQNNFLFAPILSGLVVMSVKSPLTKGAFQSRFMVGTGNISYSLYLLQFAVITLAMTMMPGSDMPSKVIKAVVIIIFSYCIAFGSFHLIERPTQSVIRGALSRWVGVRKTILNSGLEAITPRANHADESSKERATRLAQRINS